ncbi:MAG: putative metal-binding motif-containing protein [Patescibacteria group bacterium]
MSSIKSVLGFFVIAGFLVACSDASQADFPNDGTAGEAGSAGSAGNSSIVPPDSGCGGSGGSVAPSTGGSAGEAGSSSVTPPDAGAAGSNPSTDAGTICAGVTCEFGHASACVQNDTVYECSCLGIYLPQGVNIPCGDSGTAGSGGSDSDAGSVVIPPEAGAAGAGGSSSTGGSGGSSSTGGSGGSATGGSGGSTSTGGSGGTAGTGGTGGNTAVAGTMVVTIVAPTTGSHTYTVHAQTLSFMPGEPDWNSPKTVTGTRAVVSYTAYPNSVFKLGGYYDPPSSDPTTLFTHQFCSPASLKLTATVFATLDGKALPAPIVKSNGQNGCDLWITATPLTPKADDVDGDGFLANSSDPNVKDCDDAAAEVHPGQIETPDDSVDMDCDKKVNPASVVYKLMVGQQSFIPVLQDLSPGHVGTHDMSWNVYGYYELFMPKPAAATEFVIQYGPGQWSVGWNIQSPDKCTDYATVNVGQEGNIPLTTGHMAYPNNNPPTCHTVVYGL